jgi:hypothetical protein
MLLPKENLITAEKRRYKETQGDPRREKGTKKDRGKQGGTR